MGEDPHPQTSFAELPHEGQEIWQISSEIKSEIEETIAQVKGDFDRQFKDTRTRFLSDCDSLRSEQDESWGEI
ncbi:MAG TPA: hypothetical protein EYP39_03930, partial [Ghiorsea sp.]|nr:hypothetical protein [Ghiorsea sp.]